MGSSMAGSGSGVGGVGGGGGAIAFCCPSINLRTSATVSFGCSMFCDRERDIFKYYHKT